MFVSVGLILATLLAYFPCLNGEFLWDDVAWTSDIADLLATPSGLIRMWTSPSALQQYYPITGWSFWLDHQLWGNWTTPYHVENVLLHATAAILFWRLLRRLQIPGALMAAFVFALHPMMVQSVAWIAERKNVLSLVFFLGAILAYDRWHPIRRENEPDGGRRHLMIFFALSLGAVFSKVTTCVLPVVILALIWWSRGGLRWRRDVAPLLPLFVLFTVVGASVAMIEKQGGAAGADFDLSIVERTLIAGRALCFYLGRLLWPHDIWFIYPRWQLDARSFTQWSYVACAIVLLLVAWLGRKATGRALPTAMFCFVATLFPVLGFLNVYTMKFSFVWNHWVYLSSLVVFAIVSAWGTPLIVRKLGRAGGVCAGGLVLTLLAGQTWKVTHEYKDPETHWQSLLRHDPRCWYAHVQLGDVLSQRGRFDAAVGHYRECIAIKPDHAEAHNNLGHTLQMMGKFAEAKSACERAVELQPSFVAAHCNLGVACYELGEMDQAFSSCKKALDIQPDFVTAHYALGNIHLRGGRLDEALKSYDRAATLQPSFFQAHCGIGNTLMVRGNPLDALRHYNRALDINPGHLDSLVGLGNCLASLGQIDAAVFCFQRALRLDSQSVTALNNLAWIEATSADASAERKSEAATLATRAADLTRRQRPEILITLAAALAANGRFDEAVSVCEEALANPVVENNKPLTESLKKHREEYVNHRAIRQGITKPKLNDAHDKTVPAAKKEA